MSSIPCDVDSTEPWPRRIGRPLARLMGISLGIGAGTVLLGAAVIAVFGAAADVSGTLRVPLANGTRSVPDTLCFAGILPVAYLVRRIGGPFVQVETLVQPSQDPHTFVPTPRQAIQLGKARLFFRVGMPFEDRLIEQVVAGPSQIIVVDTAAGIVRRASSDEDEGPNDPHVWLSPPLLKIMSANIAAALCRADPAHEHTYQDNLKPLAEDLDALDRRIAGSLAPYRGQTFYVFHPAFGYFADRYGMKQESVEVEGKPPTPRQVFRLVQKARDEHVQIIFVQPQFNRQIAASIAEAIGGKVMTMDDMAADIEDNNIVANLDNVARQIGASNRENAP
jgi:zinc transport system substrate-binding protein